MWEASFNFQTRRLQRSSPGLLEMMHYGTSRLHYGACCDPTWEALCNHLIEVTKDSALQVRAESAMDELLSQTRQLCEGNIAFAECALVVPSASEQLEGRWIRVQLILNGGFLRWLIDESKSHVDRKNKSRTHKSTPWSSALAHFIFKNAPI